MGGRTQRDVAVGRGRGRDRPLPALACVVLAPLGLLAARILDIGGQDPFASPGSSGRFLASHLVSLSATLLLLPAAFFLVSLLPPTRRRAASVGAGLVVLGVVGGAGVFALDFASVELARAGEPNVMRGLFTDMLANPGIRLLRTLEVALPIGLLVLAWALRRKGGVGWPSALAIAAGALFSNPALRRPVGLVGALLLVVGLGGIAAALLRRAVSRPTAQPL